MPLDPSTTPNAEIVKAFTLMLGNEAGRMAVGYLNALVDHISDDKKDDTGRIDPMKLAQGDMARWLLRHIKSIPALPNSREWQALEQARRLQAAASKMEKTNG